MSMKTKIIISAVDRFTRPVKRMTKSTRQLGSSMSGLRAAVAGIGLGLVAKQALQAGIAFQSTLADLSAITGATGSNLDFMRKKAMEFSASTVVSAQDAVEAFKLVASAKPDLLSNAHALASVTKQAIILSEASGVTLATAAKTVGASLNQFSADADQTKRFINVLAAGAKFGASEIDQTSQALKMAGVVASQSGLSFEETNAAIQLLAKGALKGSEAGTGLRGVLLKLETQTEKQFKPSVVGLSGALKNLRDANLTTTAQKKLFGEESIVAAKLLIKEADNADILTRKLTGTNTAYDQARIKTGTLEADVKRLKTAFQNMGISAEGAGNIGLRSVVEGFTQILTGMGDVGGGADSLSLQIAQSADVLGNFARGIALPFVATADAIASVAASISFLREGEFKKALNVQQQGGEKIIKLFDDATNPLIANRFENNYRKLIAERNRGNADQNGIKADVGGTLKLEITGAPVRVREMRMNGPMSMNVDTGPLPVGSN